MRDLTVPPDVPAPIHLVRRDPGRNMARFYKLIVTTDLFDVYWLVREWGRIGSPGAVRHEPFPDLHGASQRFASLCRAKPRKGYRLTTSEQLPTT